MALPFPAGHGCLPLQILSLYYHSFLSICIKNVYIFGLFLMTRRIFLPNRLCFLEKKEQKSRLFDCAPCLLSEFGAFRLDFAVFCDFRFDISSKRTNGIFFFFCHFTDTVWRCIDSGYRMMCTYCIIDLQNAGAQHNILCYSYPKSTTTPERTLYENSQSHAEKAL